ncbi:MAG TPA: hypothetical protein VFH61_06520 [Thermoleophilia bacterium]|nr:hypothetical protein [Thermoleophilia bacterium]
MPELTRKYGVAATIRFPMIIAGGSSLAGSGDWTPAAADCLLSENGAATAQSTNVPTFGNMLWELDLTATEMENATVDVRIVDVAGGEVEDQVILVETFGHASALRQLEADDFATDLDVYSAKIFPMVSAVTPENLWGVTFFKNGIEMTGAAVAALNPKITVYDGDAVVLINNQALSQVTAQNAFKFTTGASLMTAGEGYFAEVTHDSMTSWTEPISIWN